MCFQQEKNFEFESHHCNILVCASTSPHSMMVGHTNQLNLLRKKMGLVSAEYSSWFFFSYCIFCMLYGVIVFVLRIFKDRLWQTG